MNGEREEKGGNRGMKTRETTEEGKDRTGE